MIPEEEKKKINRCMGIKTTTMSVTFILTHIFHQPSLNWDCTCLSFSLKFLKWAEEGEEKFSIFTLPAKWQFKIKGSKWRLLSIFFITSMYYNFIVLVQGKGNKTASSTMASKEIKYLLKRKKTLLEPAGLLYSWQSFLMWALDPHR